MGDSLVIQKKLPGPISRRLAVQEGKWVDYFAGICRRTVHALAFSLVRANFAQIVLQREVSGMVEKDLENALVAILRRGLLDRRVLKDIRIVSGTSDANYIYDLVGNLEYIIFQDTSDWNPEPKLMIDVAGGITPDIVLRSTVSGENRVYIEVKHTEELRDVAPFSQIVRQFLHLLGTTRQSPYLRSGEIRRAVLLAAPSAWFETTANITKWRYFLDKYADLAKLPEVDITLGELRLEAFV